MLSRSFKSHDELQLTEPQHAALIKVLGMLERNEFTHKTSLDQWIESREEVKFFDMSGYHVKGYRCGTVGCIAGWCHEVSHGKVFPGIDEGLLAENLSPETMDLFHAMGHDRATITPPQAARALNNYLVTGAPRWAEVLA